MSMLLTAVLLGQLNAATPPELGAVGWGRDFDAAAETAKTTGRPLLVLFDEVPGCQTCVRYGASTLSHPLLVEAAETLFVPVAVYNNVGGRDREVLERFGEPTWNNPVVRITDPSGRPLSPRLAGDYRASALAERMLEALRAADRPRPRWLIAVAAEARPKRRAYVGMHCFWSGEACLGRSSSILSTRTGWMGGGEVVEIEIARGTEDEALAAARRCGDRLFSDDEALRARAIDAKLASKSTERFRPTPKDDLHSLRRSPWAALPMAPLQATWVNAALAAGADPSPLLSPRQLALAARLKGMDDLPDPRQAADLKEAYGRLEAAL